jgi:hypothetical protein
MADPENTPRASVYQNRGSGRLGTIPTSAYPSRPKPNRVESLGAASAGFSKEPRTSRPDWKESHETRSRGSSPHRNESLLRSYLSFPSIPQTEAPSAWKKRVIPKIEIEDSESDGYPAFNVPRSLQLYAIQATELVRSIPPVLRGGFLQVRDIPMFILPTQWLFLNHQGRTCHLRVPMASKELSV